MNHNTMLVDLLKLFAIFKFCCCSNSEVFSKEEIQIASDIAKELKAGEVVFLGGGERTIRSTSKSGLQATVMTEEQASRNFITFLERRVLIVHKTDRKFKLWNRVMAVKTTSPRRCFAQWLIFVPTDDWSFQPPLCVQLIVALKFSPRSYKFFEELVVLDTVRKSYFGSWSVEDGLITTNLTFSQRRSNFNGTILLKNHFGPGRIWDFDKHLIIPQREAWQNIAGHLHFKIKNADINARNTHITEYPMVFDTFGNKPDRIFPTSQQACHMFIKSGGDSVDPYYFIRSFEPSVWLWLFIYIFIGSAVLMFANGFSLNQLYSQFTVLAAFCNQDGTDMRPRKRLLPARIAELTVKILALFIVPAFAGAITSFLTTKRPVLPFKTLEEFLALKTYKMFTMDKSYIYYHFKVVSQNPTIKEIGRDHFLSFENENDRTAIKILCSGSNLVYIGWHPIDAMNPPCAVQRIPQPVLHIMTSISATPGLGLSFIFKEKHLYFLSSGQYSRLLKMNSKPPPIRYMEPFHSIELQIVQIIFYLLLGGILASIIIIFIEMAVSRKRIQMEKKVLIPQCLRNVKNVRRRVISVNRSKIINDRLFQITRKHLRNN